MSTTESTFTPATTAATSSLTHDELATFREILGVPEKNAVIESLTQTKEAIKSLNSTVSKLKKISENIQDMMLVLGHQTNAFNKIADGMSTFAKSNADIAKCVQDLCFSQKHQELALNKLVESNKTASDTIAKAIYVNAAKTEKAFSSANKPIDVNGLFYSTFDENDKTMWIKRIDGIACTKCLETGCKTTDEFYEILYSDMKRVDHYDVGELLSQYKKIDSTADIIKMCANSDALRLSVEKRINNIHYKNYVKSVEGIKAKAPKVSYAESHRCPGDISALIKKITGASRPSGVQYRKILRQILQATNMSEADIVSQIHDEFNIDSCNVWFAVSKFPNLVNALQELAAAK
jgi:hypothetical protein